MTYTRIWDPMNGQVNDSAIKRDADGAFIPFDERNVDYQEYLRWLDEGNEPAAAEIPPPPPPPGPSLEDVVSAMNSIAEALRNVNARLDKLENK